MNNKNWYAVITADVLYDQRLTSRQKVLMAVISNLSNEKGYCFASNDHFSEMLNCSISSIQRDLSVLEDIKYLGRVIKLKPNGEVEMRVLTPIAPVTPPHSTDEVRGHSTGAMYNNISSINNKINISFDEFWYAYDKKTGKQKAQANWKKLSDDDRTKAMAYIPQYISAQPDKKFRLDPERYISRKKWEDEIIDSKPIEAVKDPKKGVPGHLSFRAGVEITK